MVLGTSPGSGSRVEWDRVQESRIQLDMESLEVKVLWGRAFPVVELALGTGFQLVDSFQQAGSVLGMAFPAVEWALGMAFQLADSVLDTVFPAVESALGMAFQLADWVLGMVFQQAGSVLGMAFPAVEWASDCFKIASEGIWDSF